MSNTGHKGIYSIWMNGCAWFKVTVMWKGRRKDKFIRKGHHVDPLGLAIEVRNEVEKQMGKPRTERKIQSRGIITQPNGNVIEWEYK